MSVAQHLITLEALAAIGASPQNAQKWLGALVQTCETYDINTPARICAFLAQIGHESGGLRYTTEIWGPTEAQKTYEGRKNLGNTQPGDGARFKGHGLIQVTGRFNHAAARDGMRDRLLNPPDFEVDPDALATPPWAALTAGWYWHSRALNALADVGNFVEITRKINGGLNGHADRVRRWEEVQRVIGLQPGLAVVPTPKPPAAAPVPAPSTRPVPPEESMTPFIQLALPAIIDAVPKLASLFSSGSAVAERNIKAAETVVSVAKGALAAANEQDLVEKLQTDPAAAEAVRAAVEANWFKIHQEAEKSVAAAREFAASYSSKKDVRTVLGNFTFPELLTLIFVLISAVGAGIVLVNADYSPEIKGSIITLMLVAGYTGVREFWFGSSPAEQARAGRKDAP